MKTQKTITTENTNNTNNTNINNTVNTMKTLTTLTQQSLNEKLKISNEQLKEAYTSLGKIRNMALTVNGLDADFTAYLKGTKVKTEFGKISYNSLAQTMYFDFNGYSNIAEMLTTLSKIYISVSQYQQNMITVQGLEANLYAYFSKKLNRKVTAQIKSIDKIQTIIGDLKESYKKTSFPLVKELISTNNDKLKKASEKLELLNAQVDSFEAKGIKLT
jgi:hypothetical protein